LLATWSNNIHLASAYAKNATALKARFNEALWDAEQGMYMDNTNSTLAPSDGNSLALLFNITNSQERANNVSQGLKMFWNDIGSVAPELPDNIAPFVGSLEV
jgi:neutral trehalase